MSRAAHHARRNRRAVWAQRRGHSQNLQARPVDHRRQRRELGVARVPARQPCGRAERLRPAPDRAAVGRGRETRARGARLRPSDRQRRHRRIRRRAARPSARRGIARADAQRRHRRERARRRRRARDAQLLQALALAERLGERPQLRVEDGPAAHRARVRPRPPRTDGKTWGSNGPKPQESRHARSKHTHACT
jgi:hypothetical protein